MNDCSEIETLKCFLSCTNMFSFLMRMNTEKDRDVFAVFPSLLKIFFFISMYIRN